MVKCKNWARAQNELRVKTESKEIFYVLSSKEKKESVGLKPKLTSQIETVLHQKAKIYILSFT